MEGALIVRSQSVDNACVGRVREDEVVLLWSASHSIPFCVLPVSGAREGAHPRSDLEPLR